mmetsp:Transcript_51517/g.120960  ORF Transcript_51517/g.120960 Transcript_51517/m.120960 type:complete len:111 (+) Transcript_51517:1318-1650(+)
MVGFAIFLRLPFFQLLLVQASASVLLSPHHFISGYYADLLLHYNRMQRFGVTPHPFAISLKRFGWWDNAADGNAVVASGRNATPVVQRLSTGTDGKRCDAGVYHRKTDAD